jgi:hypothetical protein
MHLTPLVIVLIVAGLLTAACILSHRAEQRRLNALCDQAKSKSHES